MNRQSKKIAFVLVLVATGMGVYISNSESDIELSPEFRTDIFSAEKTPTENLVEENPAVDPEIAVDGTILENRNFVTASESTFARMQPWYEDVFLAQFQDPKAIIRRTFVMANGDNFRQQLTHSLEGGKLSNDIDSRIELFLFSDAIYDIVVNKFRLGSTGYANFSAEVISADGLGRQYFKIRIAPDGRISGKGVTSTGVYFLSPTPDHSVLLVYELDEHIAAAQIRVD